MAQKHEAEIHGLTLEIGDKKYTISEIVSHSLIVMRGWSEEYSVFSGIPTKIGNDGKKFHRLMNGEIYADYEINKKVLTLFSRRGEANYFSEGIAEPDNIFIVLICKDGKLYTEWQNLPLLNNDQ